MYRRDTRQTAFPSLKVSSFLSTPSERYKRLAVNRADTRRAVIPFSDLSLFLASPFTRTSRLAVCPCGTRRDVIPFSNFVFVGQVQLHTTFRYLHKPQQRTGRPQRLWYNAQAIGGIVSWKRCLATCWLSRYLLVEPFTYPRSRVSQHLTTYGEWHAVRRPHSVATTAATAAASKTPPETVECISLRMQAHGRWPSTHGGAATDPPPALVLRRQPCTQATCAPLGRAASPTCRW